MSPANLQILHLLLACCLQIVLVVWLSACRSRVLHSAQRALLSSIGISLITLIGIHFLRFQLREFETLNRYLWYAYFIPFITIPFSTLRLAILIDQPQLTRGSWRKRHQRLRFALLSLYLSLIIFFLSNDFHKLILDFTLDKNGSYSYRYGILLFPLNILVVLILGFGVFIMLRKGLANPNRFSVLIALLCFGLSIVFMTYYSFSHSLLGGNELVLMVTVLFLLFFEIAQQTNIIPINRGYKQLFENSTLAMQIIDGEGKVYLASANANKFSPEFIAYCIKERKACELVDNLIHTAKIKGGYILWQEDISELKALREDLKDNTRSLIRANRILKKKHKSQAKTLLEAERVAIFDNLEILLSQKLKKLNQLILEYPEAEDQELALGRILAILCYIKRRSSFYFKTDREGISAQDLLILFDELSEFAYYAKVEVINIVRFKGQIKLDQLSLLYDFFYAVLANCSNNGGARVIVDLEENSENEINLRITPSNFAADQPFSSSLLKAIDDLGAELITKKIDNSVGLNLVLRGRPIDDRILQS